MSANVLVQFRSILGHRTAPSGEVNGFLTLRKLHRRYECTIKIEFNELTFDSTPQKVRP
jgi:hypothetical protein